VRAAQGCHDAALCYGAPFVSGKDSLNNEYVDAQGRRASIPPTLLISALGFVPDVRRAVTMDLKAPGDRLYVLDAKGNSIKRYTPANGRIGTGYEYLRGKADLKNAVAMAIDGSVYALLPTGNVMKFTRGNRDAYDVSGADPAVTAATRIRAGEDGEVLAILEPSAARIVAYDKRTGALIAQYESPELRGAGDFLYDEKNRVFYVASGNRILKFTVR